jgi:hypothetical protein
MIHDKTATDSVGERATRIPGRIEGPYTLGSVALLREVCKPSNYYFLPPLDELLTLLECHMQRVPADIIMQHA